MIIFFLLVWPAGLSSQETAGTPANTSSPERVSRTMFEVPRVPNSKQSPRFDNYDHNEDHFENRYDDTNNEELWSPCTLLVERFKERLLRDQARIVVYGSSRNDFSQSAVMTGFNSFVVKECSAPAQGLLLLRLAFNEITIATSNRNREQDRNHQADHFNRHHSNRYRNNWKDEGEYGDYRVSLVDPYQRWDSEREYDGHGHYGRGYARGYDREFDRDYDRDDNRNYDRNHDREYDRNHDRSHDRNHDRNHDRKYDRGYDRDYERDIVQAYGVVLEFGYISKTAADANNDRPLAGVTISLSDVKFRTPGDQSKLMMSAFKEDLELQLENIFDDVIRDIKSEARPELYEDRQRYKRDVEFLDAEIAKLQEGLPRRKYNFDRRNTKRKRKCRCKRDSSPDVEGRKGHEFNNKWKKTKTKPNRKSKDPINDKQKKSFDRDQLLLERRMARIKRRKEKRVRKQKWKKGKVWSNCSC